LRGQSEIGWESREKAQRSEIEKPKWKQNQVKSRTSRSDIGNFAIFDQVKSISVCDYVDVLVSVLVLMPVQVLVTVLMTLLNWWLCRWLCCLKLLLLINFLVEESNFSR
jgi:hypothetical protein